MDCLFDASGEAGCVSAAHAELTCPRHALILRPCALKSGLDSVMWDSTLSNKTFAFHCSRSAYYLKEQIAMSFALKLS
eukprot:6454901-Amphidinium_carterae.2